MLLFAKTCESIAATTRKTEKVRIVADYLNARSVDEAAVAALFLSGRAFPAYTETTLQVGGSMLWQGLKDVSSVDDTALAAAYRKHGDLGAAAYDVLIRRELQQAGAAQSQLTLLDVARRLREIADARRAAMKVSLVSDMLARATALEAK